MQTPLHSKQLPVRRLLGALFLRGILPGIYRGISDGVHPPHPMLLASNAIRIEIPSGAGQISLSNLPLGSPLPCRAPTSPSTDSRSASQRPIGIRNLPPENSTSSPICLRWCAGRVRNVGTLIRFHFTGEPCKLLEALSYEHKGIRVEVQSNASPPPMHHQFPHHLGKIQRYRLTWRFLTYMPANISHVNREAELVGSPLQHHPQKAQHPRALA
jgi:hypothetical protein